MLPNLLRVACLALLAVTTLGCSDGSGPSDATTETVERADRSPTRSLTAKPRAFGDVNKITVLADEELLATPVGDSIRYYYQQAYPLMPQPEALYDLTFLTPDDLLTMPARKERRTFLVVADLRDESSPTTQMVMRDVGEEKIFAARENYRKGTSIVTNRWATDQLIVYLFAEGPDEVAKLITESFKAASERIARADADKLEANIYQSGHASTLADSVALQTGLRIDLPSDYRKARLEEDFAWLRRDLGVVVQNLMVTVLPYTGEEQISRDSAIHYRNFMGRKAVRSNTVGSYMTTNDEDLPVLTEVVDLNGNYALEARGIWEMTDDYMGGPFFTYLMPDAEAGKLYVIDAWVFAPSKGKRNYMQQLERIVQTVEVE